MKRKATTLDMEIDLLWHYGVSKNIIITNTYECMFETDVLVISSAGYATGIEIKVSKSDLRNDLKKKHIAALSKPWNTKGYDMVSTAKEHYFGYFKRFYYAVPEHLEAAALEQIPDFCGLLVRKTKADSYRSWIEEVRKPKPLFKYKWSEKEMLRVAHLGTMRILGLKQAIRGYQISNTQQTLF